MAKLDAIQLQIGLPLNIDQITGQNKFEGQCHIPKIVAKMAILWPKIASATLAKLHLLVLDFGFWATTKNYAQIFGTCPGHHGQLISQNCVLPKIRV